MRSTRPSMHKPCVYMGHLSRRRPHESSSVAGTDARPDADRADGPGPTQGEPMKLKHVRPPQELAILQWPDPRLSVVSEEVAVVVPDGAFVDDMLYTMYC